MVNQVNNKEDCICVSEDCQCCGKEMTDEKYIYIGLDDDRYYCKNCVDKYDIEAVKCKELDY
jgi:hypothetical protein